MNDEHSYYYQHCLDFGMLRLDVPKTLSNEDCDDMAAHFALVLKQSRRRASKSDKPQVDVTISSED